MAANIELLKKIIIDNQRIVNNISLIRRSITFEEKGNYVFVGIRQAGKSYLLYQRMQQLIAEGHSLDEMLYVSFDDERLNGMRADELDLLLQSHRIQSTDDLIRMSEAERRELLEPLGLRTGASRRQLEKYLRLKPSR